MKQQKYRDVRRAWDEFSETGAVGAYLTYRAMLTQQKRPRGE